MNGIDKLFTGVLVTLFLLLLLASAGFYVYDLFIDQSPTAGMVTDVARVLSWGGDPTPVYVVQLGGGAYFPLGKSAGVNLRVGECYLLRKGAGSRVFNLFEPIPCKEGW